MSERNQYESEQGQIISTHFVRPAHLEESGFNWHQHNTYAETVEEIRQSVAIRGMRAAIPQRIS